MRSALVAMLLAPLALSMPTMEDIMGRQASCSIQAKMKAKGKLYFGTCADQNRLGAAQNQAVIKGNMGQVTPENSMKWDATERKLFFRMVFSS